MRKHLAADCDAIYILDLGGNARKGLKVSNANVFGIRVGVSINLFVKKKQKSSESRRIFYYPTDELWNRKQKFDFLIECQHTKMVLFRGNLFNPMLGIRGSPKDSTPSLTPLFRWEVRKQKR